MNLENMKEHKRLLAVILLSFLGFLDATYLTIQHYSGIVPPCDVTHACETVLTSRFATVGPIPIAAFGMGYFVAVMVLAILYIQKNSAKLLRYLFILVTLGFLAGLGLLYIQAGILHAFCQYCLATEAMLTGIFLLSAWVWYKGNHHERSRSKSTS